MKEALVNIDAEQSVLGGCMIGGKATVIEVQEILSEIDFFHERHRIIWKAICELAQQDKLIDIITVSEQLGDDLVKVGGIPYLITLSNKNTSYKNVVPHCQIIKNKSIARQKIAQCCELIRQLEEGEEPLELISQSMVFDSTLISNTRKNEIIHVKEKTEEVFEEIKKRRDSSGVVGQATGFPDFDLKVGGLRRGNLHIMAARPAMGKTTFALNIARNVAVKQRKPVLFISLEMTNVQLVEKLIAENAGIDNWKLQNVSKLSDSEWRGLEIAANNLYQSKLYLADSHRLKASEIATKVRRFKSLNPDLALIIIDYIQIMNAESKAGKNFELGETSGILQGLAKELNIPILALSQLSRDVERREDKRPVLSDLRDSGSLEQDAATVMFLYRDDYYRPDKYPSNNDPSHTELIIAKNRFGATGKLHFMFLKSKSRFEQITKEKLKNSLIEGLR